MKKPPNTKPVLIRGGRLVDPASAVDGYMDVLLEGGKVAQVGKPGSLTARGAEPIDARGLVVAPGLVDIHVHLREPG